jgi:hypothetical protein
MNFLINLKYCEQLYYIKNVKTIMNTQHSCFLLIKFIVMLDSRDAREIRKTPKICRLIILLPSQHTYILRVALPGIYVR